MNKLTTRRMAAALLLLATPAVLPVGAAYALVPGSTAAVNVDKDGVALRGYDPVAYFDSGLPTPGDAKISETYEGARYFFASEEHRKAFAADPKKYVPEFGGFCAVGTSFGEKVDADPHTGKVVNGHLYVNFNAKVAGLFAKDTSGTIQRAEEKWPEVKGKAAN